MIQDSMMTSGVSSMLSEDTIELGPGNKGFFIYPFMIPKKKGESHFIMNLKPLNQFITCTKFKITTIKHLRKAHSSRTMGSLTLTSCQHTATFQQQGDIVTFLHFRWKGKVYQLRTLPFGLFTTPKTFMRVTHPMSSPMLRRRV